MLTRRTALGVLPAGAVSSSFFLDAFVETAEGQTTSRPPRTASTTACPSPLPNPVPPDSNPLQGMINDTNPLQGIKDYVVKGLWPDESNKDPDPQCLELFVKNCKEFGANFDTHKAATVSIVEFFDLISRDDFPLSITVDKLSIIKQMADDVDGLLDLIGGRDANHKFKTRYLMDLSELGVPEPQCQGPDAKAHVNNLREATIDLWQHLKTQTPFPEIKIKPPGQQNPITIPNPCVYQMLAMSADDLSRYDPASTERRFHGNYKDKIYDIAYRALHAGFALARDDTRYFNPIFVHAAASAFCVVRCSFRILRYFSGPEATQRFRILRAAESWSMALLADAYDFFDDNLSDIMATSEQERNAINDMHSLVSDDKGVYLGSSTDMKPSDTWNRKLEIINYYLKLTLNNNPLPSSDFGLPIGKGLNARPPNDGTKKQPFGRVRYDNGKLYPPPYAFGPVYIYNTSPTVEPEPVRVSDILNDRERPALTEIPPAGGENTRRSMFTGAISNKIRSVNEDIRRICNDFRDIQLEYNCWERMTWALIRVLGKG